MMEFSADGYKYNELGQQVNEEKYDPGCFVAIRCFMATVCRFGLWTVYDF
jgi:hypothetical protein